MKKRFTALVLVLILLLIPSSALAQDYYFSLPNYNIHVYWNEDGTMAIDYVFDFANDPSGHAIEYVDVGIPNGNFRVSDIYADVDGQQLNDISRSGYEGVGTGVAVGLGRHAIPPGGRGQVHVFIARVEGVLNTDTTDPAYASAVFSPTWFGSRYVFGTTNMAVTFHLPPGVQPDEPRWHSAPNGFPQEPDTGIDEDGRVLYTWRNPNASPDRQYLFGASFPRQYVPEEAFQPVSPPSEPFGVGGLNLDCFIPFLCFGFFGLIFGAAILSERRRKLQYLPPKISIEGHGIKRGLTAVEAAILMEQPMDKVMTMILFGVIKKNLAQVISRDPLRLEIAASLPEDLRSYEKDFLEAFRKDTAQARQRELQSAMVALIKSVSQKMKGFSRKETVAYYKDIQERAWQQVEAAETPEVKSQKFDENMEWTMLDREYDRRTRDVFRTGPVFVPTWWGRYDPGFGRSAPASTGSAPGPASPGRTGGGFARPNLPGGEFAASMVTGVQTFSSSVVGNISDFTSRVTRVTNPPPPPSSRSTGTRGGGGGCACACACAGCACACAGGGR